MTYKGKRISAKGVYTKTFTVGIYWGTMKVKATGQYAGRSNTKTFRVVRRTHDLSPRWS